MRRKGIFTILMAAFMVLAFSAMALAANNVRLTTTVPNIPKSTCYQAGTDTLEFDTGSAVAEMDVVQITLNNKVTLCKTINMFVAVNAPNVAVLETSADTPVATTGGTVNATGTANKQWGWLVKGAAGSQIITAQFRVRDTVAGLLDASAARVMLFSGTTPADKLLVKLFDSKIGVGTSLIYKQAPVPVVDTYFTAIIATDNILCIDTLTQDFPDEYVQNTPDSIPVLAINKLFFSGDYRIAHIMTAQTFDLVTCKGATCGNIPLGVPGQTGTCVAFNYETIGGTGLPYCSNHTANTGFLPKFVLQTSQPFDLVPYVVTAEILVNGVAGERGVYWSNIVPAYATSPTTLCGVGVAGGTFAGQTYLRGDGVTAAVPVAPITGNCAGVAAAAKAVKITTTSGALFVAGDLFFELNLPSFNYNLAEVNAGDVVSVRVTLTKGTCGTVSKDLCIGTFITSCPLFGAGAVRLCPYVTSLAAGDTYWDGIAVVNTGAVAGTVDLKAFKNDGTTSTFTTPSIAAGGMYVKLLSGIPWVGTTPVGVPAYITLQAAATIPAGSLDAFVMMADGANNSMGYLCR
jgi:hypothetical protein